MPDNVRVGLVGADASGSGWGSVAHIPGLAAAEGIELAAVCTSRPESAAAAGEAYGVPSFHDVHVLAAQPDIDLVSVVVRVPKHRELVMAALEGGKHVFSEWPLGANSAEAEDMAAAAGAAEVVTGVGLQGRQDPSLTMIRQLHADGWLGQVTSVNVTMMGGGALAHRTSDAWMGTRANGANFLTIVGGHTLDALTYCISPFVELSGSVATLFPEWQLADTGETIEVDAPDNAAVTGVLEGGAMVSVRVGSVPHNASGWRMEIYGTEGTIIATTAGLPQITPVTLTGARGEDALGALPVSHGADVADRSGRFPPGPPGNVGRAYEQLGQAIRDGRSFSPGFAHASELHQLLDTIQRSSDEGGSIAVR